MERRKSGFGMNGKTGEEGQQCSDWFEVACVIFADAEAREKVICDCSLKPSVVVPLLSRAILFATMG